MICDPRSGGCALDLDDQSLWMASTHRVHFTLTRTLCRHTKSYSDLDLAQYPKGNLPEPPCTCEENSYHDVWQMI
jgi:hypothetical protein